MNIHGLFALTVCYGDINTYLPKKYYYIIERVYFIYRLFVLFISTLSSLLLLYKASWRYIREYLHVSTDILFYSMFYIINMMEKQTLYTTFVLTLQKRYRFELRHRYPKSDTQTKATSANILTLFQRCLLVETTSRRWATSNQCWNKAVYFNVNMNNVRQRRNNVVKMIISKNNKTNHFKSNTRNSKF